MCGFVGCIHGSDGQLSQHREILEAMMQRIVHRGPDSAGYFEDERASLGFRRLSIIDLTECGNQPFYSEDERYVMVFNGEIYNYQELREELMTKGHRFISETDSEVIIRGYEEYGEAIVAKLRGMFAFVIWDRQEEEAFLARDGFGIKPLYYTNHTSDGTFLFGSEIKSFLDHPNFIKEFNEKALRPYLTFQYNPLDECFFKGVYLLAPAHYMKVKKGEIEEQVEYWDKRYQKEADRSRSFEDYVKDIQDTMKESVDYHKLSDVKVGSFLSGGVDSSLVTALLKPETTFSVGFDQYESSFNETDLAQDLSQQLGIQNKRQFISGQEAFDALETIMYHLDEPDSNPSVVPLYFLAQLAAKDVTVVLSGEGADEIFGGYAWYQPTRLSDYYRKLPLGLRRIAQRIWHKDGKTPNRLSQFVDRGVQPIEQRFIGQALVYPDQEAYSVLREPYETATTSTDITRPYYKRVADQSDLNKMQYLDMNLWMPGDILQKADKMSMAHSLELRVPFLDKEVMELAKTLPEEYRADYEDTKVALRKAAEAVLPDAWAHRKKVGFPVPIRHWLREEPFFTAVHEMFLSDLASEFFEADVLLQLLDDHRDQKGDYGRRIWTAYVFLVWFKRFFVDDKGACQTVMPHHTYC